MCLSPDTGCWCLSLNMDYHLENHGILSHRRKQNKHNTARTPQRPVRSNFPFIVFFFLSSGFLSSELRFSPFPACKYHVPTMWREQKACVGRAYSEQTIALDCRFDISSICLQWPIRFYPASGQEQSSGQKRPGRERRSACDKVPKHASSEVLDEQKTSNIKAKQRL